MISQSDIDEMRRAGERIYAHPFVANTIYNRHPLEVEVRLMITSAPAAIIRERHRLLERFKWDRHIDVYIVPLKRAGEFLEALDAALVAEKIAAAK